MIPSTPTCILLFFCCNKCLLLIYDTFSFLCLWCVCVCLCSNDFSRMVAEEYLSFFNFTGLSLDQALRWDACTARVIWKLLIQATHNDSIVDDRELGSENQDVDKFFIGMFKILEGWNFRGTFKRSLNLKTKAFIEFPSLCVWPLEGSIALLQLQQNSFGNKPEQKQVGVSFIKHHRWNKLTQHLISWSPFGSLT